MALYYNQKNLTKFLNLFQEVYPKFNVKQIEKSIFDKNWEKKPNLQKVTIVTEEINKMIDKSYLEQLDVLLRVNDKTEYGFVNLILPHFVSVYGLEHFHESMYALKEFTKKTTSEYGIRPFVKQNPQESAFLMYLWSKDEHFRVRRLASEGCRPYLPGGMTIQAFVENPHPILPILDQLKQDNELFVKKSVSNSLNDISKKHPDLVIKICREWRTLNDANTNYIIQRACRTLLKNGNEEALQIIQEVYDGPIKILNLRVHQQVIRMGDSFDFSFQIEDTDFGKNNVIDNSMEVEAEGNDTQQKKKKTNKKKQQMEIEEQPNKNQKKGFKIEFRIDFLKLTEEYDSTIFMLENNHIMKSKQESFQGRTSTNDFTTKKMFLPGDNYLSILINGVQKYKIYYYLQNKK